MKYIRTFAEFLETDWVEEGIQDPEAAWAVYLERTHSRVEAMREDPFLLAMGAEAVLTEDVALSVVEQFFGAKWVKERFPLADERGDPDVLRCLWPAHWRRELARRVFELQNQPWFEDMVTYTETNDVNSALFEAAVLQLLLRMPADVGRVTATFKRASFDITLQLARRDPFPIEVKHKDNDTPFSLNTIRNTFRTVQRQMPTGQTGWVFMHIPAAWDGGPAQLKEYEEAVAAALRQTTRVGAVFTAVDRPGPGKGPRQYAIERHWELYRHPKAPGWLWEAAVLLKTLLDRDMDFFTAKAPF